ncbi:MAG: ABC transporter permease [Polyangiaceae bacterium]|nr:ABC transporter permease [Polyangiaceae bacterium]
MLIRYGLRSLLARKTTSLAAGLGVAMVTFVLAAALMLASGVSHTLASGGRTDVAMVLRRGSTSELSSTVSETDVRIVRATPGVASVAAETVAVLALDKVGAPGFSNVTVRGTDEGSLPSRPSVHLIEGRLPQPGTDEAMVGTQVRGRFRGVDLGGTIELRKNRPVHVVGVFADGGSSAESEVWLDGKIAAAAFGRQGSVSAVRVVLSDATAFEGFRGALEGDERLALTAVRELGYLRAQSEDLATFLRVMGWIIASFFSVGAVLGATMTMHAAIASRGREIGTLRALGFSRWRILGTFVFEATAMTGAGGILGALAATLLAFVHISMINYATWSELSFGFQPTWQALVTAGVFGIGMGLVGGLFPALRAMRMSPLQALRH